MRKLLLPVVASLAFAAGCYTQGDVAYSGGAYASGPSLYYYSPGVSVVAYSDDPVFYSDGLYWRYYGNTWYSSSYYGGGWNVAYNVPYGVRSIDRPYSYAHFTPGQGWTRVNAGGGYYGGRGGPVVRDHRTYSQPAYSAPAGGGYYRDHRSAPVYSSPSPSYSAPRSMGGGAPVVRDHRSHR